MKDSKQLGEWVKSIGLEMYQDLVEQHVPSGDRLFAMTTGQAGNSDLVVRCWCVGRVVKMIPNPLFASFDS